MSTNIIEKILYECMRLQTKIYTLATECDGVKRQRLEAAASQMSDVMTNIKLTQ